MDSIISALGQAYLFFACFSLWFQVKSGTRVALCAPHAHSHSLRASFMTIMASRTSSLSFPAEAVSVCSYCNAHYEATKTSVKRCPTCQNAVDDNKYVLLQPSDSHRLLQHRACNGTRFPPVLLQGTDLVPSIAVPLFGFEFTLRCSVHSAPLHLALAHSEATTTSRTARITLPVRSHALGATRRWWDRSCRPWASAGTRSTSSAARAAPRWQTRAGKTRTTSPTAWDATLRRTR